MITKYCNSCKQEKPLNEFGKCKSYKDGLSFYCNVCKRKKSRELTQNNPQYIQDKNKRMYIRHYKGTPKGLYYRLRDQAHKNNREIFMTAQEFIDWFEKQEKVCCYCGQSLIFHNGNTQWASSNIDRKDNSRGYSIDNIVLACRRCNTMKGDWLTSEQTLEIAQKYFSRQVSSKQ